MSNRNLLWNKVSGRRQVKNSGETSVVFPSQKKVGHLASYTDRFTWNKKKTAKHGDYNEGKKLLLVMGICLHSSGHPVCSIVTRVRCSNWRYVAYVYMTCMSHNAMVCAPVVTSSCSNIIVDLIVPKGSLVANSLQDLHSVSLQTSFWFYCVYCRISGGNRSNKLQRNKLLNYVATKVNKTL